MRNSGSHGLGAEAKRSSKNSTRFWNKSGPRDHSSEKGSQRDKAAAPTLSHLSTRTSDRVRCLEAARWKSSTDVLRMGGEQKEHLSFTPWNVTIPHTEM